jgi:signal transduction histidine kinase
MSDAPLTPAELHSIDLFADLSDVDVDAWLAIAVPRPFAEGEIIVDQNEPAPGVFLLLEGTVRTFLVDGERTEPLGRQAPPTWMGAIAVLTEGGVGARMVAETPCRTWLLPAEDFRRLALAQPEVHRRVMARVAPVMTRITGMEQHRERLAALGTMAAGLAHELNNPAAAARRAAAQMAEALDVMSATLGSFVEAGVTLDQARTVLALHREALAGAEGREPLDTLVAADAEDALLDHLEALGVREPWRLTEPLAAAGVDTGWIDRVAEAAGPATGAALAWTAATLTAGGLAAELQESTARMSGLVGAVKSYAYMDRGERVEVDLHEGLDTTLTVLGHKLKHTAIAVERDYDKTLPKLIVSGSELNQVWTNLLDNAIDAVGERGTITVVTKQDGDCALVEIIDDGPGIPPEVRERVFEDFFTTKDVGHGTGLGLATARRIVVDRHDGSINVWSEPGRTAFKVWLPLP